MNIPRRFAVILRPAAKRDLDRLPKDVRQRIRAALEQLAEQPRGMQTKRLAGSEDYRRRVGDYRIIYEIDDQISCVTINVVKHRRDVYRGR